MKIVYASSACSRRRFLELFPVPESMPGQQVQKYHRMMLEGIVLNAAPVVALTCLPVTRSNHPALLIWGSADEENGVPYEYLPIVNVPVVKNLGILLASFARTRRYLKSDPNAAVVCDVLNFSVSLGALLAAKIYRRRNVAIVTDIPKLLSDKPNRMIAWLTGLVMARYDSYVFLTEQMNSLVNRRHVPYAVIEGQVDVAMESRTNDRESKHAGFVCLYAGAVDRRYGVETLVRGFLETTPSEAELHIYGRGDFEQELQSLARMNQRLKYLGPVPNEVVVEEELKATLLVNPRPTSEEFTRFSFPSKNMEYMASGTPLLTTRLPGMPEEYLPHVYVLEDETMAGVATALETLFAAERDELHRKGREAKDFVLHNKSNIIQARRVLRLIATLIENPGPGR